MPAGWVNLDEALTYFGGRLSSKAALNTWLYRRRDKVRRRNGKVCLLDLLKALQGQYIRRERWTEAVKLQDEMEALTSGN